MSVWTAFFLVVSAVILASPLLTTGGTVKRNGPDAPRPEGENPHRDDEELELDLATGRLAREDFEEMTGSKSRYGQG